MTKVVWAPQRAAEQEVVRRAWARSLGAIWAPDHPRFNVNGVELTDEQSKCLLDGRSVLLSAEQWERMQSGGRTEKLDEPHDFDR